MIKKFSKDQYQLRKDFLKQKWGLENAEALESTHKLILNLIRERWDCLKETQKEYFERKIAWEERWQEKEKEKEPLQA